MNLAALVTWGVVAIDQLGSEAGQYSTAWLVRLLTLLLFAVSYVCARSGASRGKIRRAQMATVIQALAALTNLLAGPNTAGAALLVVAVSQGPMLFGHLGSWLLLGLASGGGAWIFTRSWDLSNGLTVAMMFTGFNLFALMASRMAMDAARTRDDLARVNAELLATRSLLEAGARDGERLRLSRELHDLAGHNLTALRMNLELAQRLPEDQRPNRVQAALSLVDQLLTDLRGVVSQLRAHDGLELAPALRLLVTRSPGPAIRLQLPADLRVRRVDQAETVLRCVQEALTNALRHAGASHVDVIVEIRERALRVQVIDDGRGTSSLTAGNGLTGMRERLTLLGGQLACASTPGHGMHLTMEIPECI